MTLRTPCVFIFVSALTGCAPEGDTVQADWLDETAPSTEEQAVAFDDAVLEVEAAVGEIDVSDPWAELDPDAELEEVRLLAEARGCRVTGTVGGVWSDEHNRLRARVKRFRGGGADLVAGWQRVHLEGGVWAGHWQSFSGAVDGSLGGLYNLDEHHLAGVWSVDDRPEGVVHAKWRRLGPKGGIVLGVWANCRAPAAL